MPFFWALRPDRNRGQSPEIRGWYPVCEGGEKLGWGLKSLARIIFVFERFEEGLPLHLDFYVIYLYFIAVRPPKCLVFSARKPFWWGSSFDNFYESFSLTSVGEPCQIEATFFVLSVQKYGGWWFPSCNKLALLIFTRDLDVYALWEEFGPYWLITRCRSNHEWTTTRSDSV